MALLARAMEKIIFLTKLGNYVLFSHREDHEFLRIAEVWDGVVLVVNKSDKLSPLLVGHLHVLSHHLTCFFFFFLIEMTYQFSIN